MGKCRLGSPIGMGRRMVGGLETAVILSLNGYFRGFA